ncbi:MAG: response regulator [Sedimentisphaerales bacterium]|nr:response regulator [Sedimentisphaerales bacterium]
MEAAGWKVLLIEDDKIDQQAFKRLIRDENLDYNYTLAGTIAEAKSILDREEFDVIIADYLLRDGTAFDILDSLRDTPVIFATGAGNEKLAVKAMKAGAYDYLIKNPERSYLAVLPLIIKNAVNHANMQKEVKSYHENLEGLVKERTEQLEAEKELLSVTFASITDGIIVVDANKRIVLFNKVAEILAGVKLEDVKGKEIDDIFRLVHERSREIVKNPIDLVLASGDVQTTIEPDIIIIGNGREYPVSAAAAPIRKPHGQIGGVVMLLHNLSQEREIDRIKRDFVSSVSHELRTPLTSIKAYVETILRDRNMSEQTKHEFLLAVDDESKRLTELVNGLLEIAQLESGGINVLKQCVDIQVVIKQVASSLQQAAKSRKIKIQVDTFETTQQLLGNESKIRSLISNLVNNAIKFTPEGGMVRVGMQYQHGGIVIYVSDTGIGIPKEEIPKIFDRFYRVHRSGRQIHGTGLGLAIVNEVAVIHGGRVEVESELGQGTTFKVFLPLFDRNEFETSGAKKCTAN